jgi:hypothetical protein
MKNNNLSKPRTPSNYDTRPTTPVRKVNTRKTNDDYIKRPLSSFNYFQIEMSAKLRDKINVNRGELQSYIGHKWSKLSDEEKEKYELLAQTDRLRYLKETMTRQAEDREERIKTKERKRAVSQRNTKRGKKEVVKGDYVKSVNLGFLYYGR